MGVLGGATAARHPVEGLVLKIRMESGSGNPILLLGLTADNIQHLQLGDPIALNLGEVDMQGLLFIMAGENQEDILRQLTDAGVLPATMLDDYREPQPGESYRLPGADR